MAELSPTGDYAGPKEVSMGDPPPVKVTKRKRYSISLSKKSADLFDEIKTYTDADTDSEVFRDALRLTYAAMLVKRAGRHMVVTNPLDPSELPIPLTTDSENLTRLLTLVENSHSP